MLSSKIILYMPYIDKVPFIHAMYRDFKMIVSFKSTLYIPCISKIVLCMVSIEI